MERKKAEKDMKEKEDKDATAKAQQAHESEQAKKRADQEVEDAKKQEEKEKMDKYLQEQKAEDEQEEKEVVNSIRNHKTSEKTAPWCTDMSDEQTRHIIRWIKTLEDTDPMMQGL
eukprot:15449188-Heterocapsa_arctica.AAC.1